MTNFASMLRSEIARVARKEVRAEVEVVKKSLNQQRVAMTKMKRELEELRRHVSQSDRAARSAAKKQRLQADQGEVRHRFSAKRLVAHRAKLGLSAAAYGKLVGMSGATIYLWERGRAPNQDQLRKLARLRSMGKSEIAELLALPDESGQQ